MTPTRSLRPRSIRALLVALVLAIVIPLVGLQIWSTITEFNRARESSERVALARAEAVRVAVQQLFHVSESVMVGLSEVYGARLVAEDCGNLLPGVAAVMDFLVSVLVADAEGQVICSSRELGPGGRNISEWEWFDDVQETPFVVSEPIQGTISDTWVVGIAVPIRDEEGRFLGALSGSVPLLELQNLLGGADLAEDELVTIATGSRIVLARSQDPERWVGGLLPPPNEGADREITPGRFAARGADFEGIDRTWGQVEIDEFGWVIYAGVPTDRAYGPARASATRRAAASLLILVVALALSTLFHRRLSLSLERLVTYTSGIARGEVLKLPPDTATEVREIVEDFSATMEGRKRAERAERLAVDRHQSLFDNAVFGMYVSTREGRFLQVNRALVEMLRFESAEELIEAGPGSLYRDPAERADLIAASEGHSVIEEVETEWRRKDGVTITVRLNGNVIRTEGGESAFEVIVEDVTLERRLEEERRQTQKMEAVGRLAGGIAHDFNNFLTVIGGTLDLLEADLGPDDPRREDVEEIMEVTDRARTLTRQLLDFSRGESGERGNVDMNQVVSGLERMLGRLLPATVRLETLLAEEPAVIYADLGQMEQVLMNLVINARDAVGDGGRITVTTTVLGAEGEPAEEHAYGPGVVVSVRDDGVGMDEATRSKIFEPFFTTKGPDKGTGLGLATVYGIVSSHWGRITVASEVGVGSVFEVWLPFSSTERPGSA